MSEKGTSMLRIAGYCRVSTDKQDQINSFLSQQTYFREYVERHSQWRLYDIYADEGVTGTSTCKRIQFNRMMQDAYQKKFDLIITKEVSRFSRNLLDTIAYTRELKALGIGVIFMNDGLNTLDPDAELRLSIMGSIAQEESRKTSQRVKWGQLRQMERGVVFGHTMLGYDVADGRLRINAEGAEIVRRIFFQYGVEKKGTTVIARELREAGIKTLSGNPHWRESYIIKILKNEKYVGDLIQKKTITPDYLTHAKKYNHGEEAFVIIRDHHEPIISRELWDLVQKEINHRSRGRSSGGHSNKYLFSGKIICGECGTVFVPRIKVRKNGTKYRRWGCMKAIREGRGKTDAFGNHLGCNIGKLIRDELAMDMLTAVILNLKLDRKRLVEKTTKIVSIALRSGGVAEPTVSELCQKEQVLKSKIERIIDAYISGTLTEEEMVHVRSIYSEKLLLVQKQLIVARKQDTNSEKYELAKIQELLEEILNCDKDSLTFSRSLLEYMKVYRDGTVRIKLNQLDCIWKFRLVTDPTPHGILPGERISD